MDHEDIFEPSILQRLCNTYGGLSYEAMSESVRQDIEDLLNAVQGRDDIPSYYKELSHSIARYGIHDFDSTNLESVEERQRLLQSIQKSLQTFEPRLERIELQDLGVDKKNPFLLHFQIRAVLHVEPFREEIVFGTTIEKNGIAKVEQ